MSQKTVLYVEDNEFNRKIVRQLLSSTTYRLLEATDGEQGVAADLGQIDANEVVVGYSSGGHV